MANNYSDRRVVITGLGVVTPIGHDIDTFWKNLIAGECGVDTITAFDPTGYDTKIAAAVKGFDPTPAFPSPKEIRRTDRYSQFGVYAGWRALQDSGLELDKENCDEIGVFMGSGIGGLTTMTRDVALNLTAQPDPAGANSEVKLALSPARVFRGAKLVVTARHGELLNTVIDLVPGAPISKTISGIKTDADELKGLTVRITDASGQEVMNYLRPDENPGRKEYNPFVKALENPEKAPQQMSVEELVQAAEFKLKELDPDAMQDFVDRAL